MLCTGSPSDNQATQTQAARRILGSYSSWYVLIACPSDVFCTKGRDKSPARQTMTTTREEGTRLQVVCRRVLPQGLPTTSINDKREGRARTTVVTKFMHSTDCTWHAEHRRLHAARPGDNISPIHIQVSTLFQLEFRQ